MPPTLTCISAQGARLQLELSSLLTAGLREAVRPEANSWIKRLRAVRYDGRTMRERFTYRQDSLWWFTELYLHKVRHLDTAIATVLALEAAREAYAPARLAIEQADPIVRDVVVAFGRAHEIPVEIRNGTSRRPAEKPSVAARLTSDLVSRVRPARRPAIDGHRPVVALVHTAFWSLTGEDRADPRQERYIGLVLSALARRLEPGQVGYVGVGAGNSSRVRGWWNSLVSRASDRPPIWPIEHFATGRSRAGSRDLWHQRRELAQAIASGDEVRAAGVWREYDLWPVLRRALEEVALIQWPWSARAMDEAGAALDALTPEVVVTYAEAGGWGRALVLEARRRAVRSVGVQHGFIYRHWLNYAHQSDEIRSVGADRGCPLPDQTLLFDRYAAEDLADWGCYPASSLVVTGSARLDDLASRMACLQDDDRAGVRRQLGVAEGQTLVVLAAKFTEIRGDLASLITAVQAMPRVHLAIRPHPADRAGAYTPFVAGAPNVVIAPAELDLAPLLGACVGVVTMNSTVAIDALSLDVPALVIGLPNNLSPFVAAGVMLGADRPERIRPGLEALLFDSETRQELARAARTFTERYEMRPTGQAAERAADQILQDLGES